MTEPTTIFLSIPDGFAARFLLRSGVLRHLQDEGHRVVILSPNADEEYFQREFSNEQTFIRPLVRGGGRVTGKLRSYFDQVWRTVASHAGNAEDIRQDVERAKDRGRLVYLYRKLLWKTVAGRAWAVGLLSVLDRLLFQDRYNGHVFEEFAPDLLVVTSYGFEPGDLYLMRRARRLGVQVLYIVLQWDNPSNRPLMRERPDKIVAWSETNRQELVDFHRFPASDIYVAGPPHFDTYAHPERFCSWEEYCQRTGMDPQRRAIVLCGTTGDVTDGFDDVVQFLAEAVDEGRFAFPCQLLIRPHPITFSGAFPGQGGQGMKEDLLRYRSFGRHVFCDEPRILSQALRFDLDGRDMKHLAETISHASVVVNFFSTINLDGAAVDTPLVNLAFDGYKERDYYHSARRVADIWNNVLVLDTGGVRVAKTFPQLVDHINAYLRDPSLDAAGRREIVRRLVHRVDGEAANRVAQAISLYAQGRWILDEEPQAPSSPDQPAALFRRLRTVEQL